MMNVDGHFVGHFARAAPQYLHLAPGDLFMRTLALATLFFTATLHAGESGFTPLFNGKNLDGWQPAGAGKLESWSVKDGILTATPGGGWLATTQTYGDFILRVEWRLPTNGNSGVFLRARDLKTKTSPSQTAMEIQILDDDGPAYKKLNLKPFQYSGSLYGFVPRSKAVYRPGQWNTYEITCRGNQVVIVFNGAKVVDADLTKFPALLKRPERGHVGLQNHGSAVEFKRVEIKVLDK
jgi:hypothetical protein